MIDVECSSLLRPWNEHYLYGFALVALTYALIFTYFNLRFGSENTKTTSSNTSDFYTRIHGKWYNLSSFEHPGGPVALSLAKGRDATVLFESHHYFISREKIQKILAKFEVSPEETGSLTTIDKKDDGSPYCWENIDMDGFASDIRSLVVTYFSSIAEEKGISFVQASKATPKRWLVILLIFGVFLASIPPFLEGSWRFIVLTPILAWLTIVNYWHDATHFSLSSHWQINAALPYILPLLSSPSMWYYHHVVGHHAYTNISHKDPDIGHAPQLMREHKSIRWKPSHINQTQISRILLVWSIATGIGLNILNDLRALSKLSYNNVVSIEKPSLLRIAVHACGRIMYFFVTVAWPFFTFPIWKAFLWAMIPNAVFSLCFMLNTQINHFVGPCAHAIDSNFYRHQVLTAQNFGPSSTFCFYFSGGLNFQIEHHLFPTVNHCHLPGLSVGVKNVCEKYGVQYNSVSGYKEAITRHFDHTREMAVKPTF